MTMILNAKRVKTAIVLTVASCMMLTGCSFDKANSKINEDAMKNAYAYEVPITPDQIPNSMVDLLGQYKVVVSGEIHYAKEHQKMTSLLLERLHEKGFRYYVQEKGTSEGYMLDKYIKGEIKTLDVEQLKADEIMIESLKRFNEKLRASNRVDQQITYVGFDMNHRGTMYLLAMKQLGEYYEIDEMKVYAKSLQSEGANGSKYNDLIKTYIKVLEASEKDGNPYKKLSGAQRAQLIELSTTELTSSGIRLNWSDIEREDFIYTQVNKVIVALKKDEKMLVNCGMWHAQYVNEWKVSKDKKFTWLGMRLKKDFENDPFGVYSYSTATYKANLKKNLYTKERFDYAIGRNKNGNFVKQLQNTFDEKNVFVDFTPLNGRNEKILIDYVGQASKIKPNVQFNGLLVYPELSVAEASLFYEN